MLPLPFRAFLASLLLLLAATGGASAHAALVASDPADGSMVEAAPRTFALTFSEPVSPLVLGLVRPDGRRTALTGYSLQDRTLVIPAPENLPRGTHVLSWRVISEDGHPVGGSVVFSLGAKTATPEAAGQVDWNVRSGLWAGKVLLYVGLFLGVGGAFAGVWLARTTVVPIRLISGLLAAGLAGAVLSLGFQGLDALGAPLGSLGDPRVWQAGYATSFGRAVLAAALAFAAALASLLLPRLPARLLSLAALVGTGGALAASGHASAADPQWLMRPAVFVHGVAIALWTGALLPLGLMLRRRHPEAHAALRRFSAFIPWAVAALIAAGVVLAVVQVETPAALLSTTYGQVLLLKLALLAALFSLAALNRWRLTARVAAGEASAARRMVRSVAAETAIVLLIFGVAACWRFTPPPRVLAIAAAEPADVHIHTLDAMAEVVVAPGHAGEVAAGITVMTGDYGPLDAKEVTLVMGSKAAGIEPIRRPARKTGDGAWRVENLVLPVPGIWQVRVDVLVSDFKLVQLPAEIVIRP